MGNSQKRAIENYRQRLNARGMARFEVLGSDADRELIRSLARQLAEGGQKATLLRAVVKKSIQGKAPSKGGILAALRRSPLVDGGLELKRSKQSGRKVDL